MTRKLIITLAPVLALMSGGCDGGGDDGTGGTGGTGGDCPETTGPTDHADDITADEVWAASDGPHNITANIEISNGATLTIEPCVDVVVSADTRLWVGNNGEAGTLIAEGTASQPITFAGDGSGRWDNIRVAFPGEARFANASFNDGGADLITYDGATIVAWGDQERPLKEVVYVNNVTVSNSAGYGVISARLGGFISGSDGLAISGSGSDVVDHVEPIYIEAEALGTLPAGSYTGNALDEIRVDPRGGIETDTVIRDVGVAYRLDGIGANVLSVAREFDNDTLPVPTLTIEAGVEIRVEQDLYIRIGTDTINHMSPGALVINGTSTDPVTITSASPTPAAGDWRGIVFEEPPQTATNAIDFAVINYAGGGCSCGGWGCSSEDPQGTILPLDAAILIYSWEPASAFVTNTTINSSGGWGILRGWDGADIDFTTTNTFNDLAYCTQTVPSAPNGSCAGEPYLCTP